MKTLKELYAYRQMIISLVRKELRGRYKGSVLGFMWTFINPLLQLLVYSVVFSTILGAQIDKFYLFLFVALVPWLFFSASLTGGSASIIASKDMVKKIYFPREIMPISYVTSAFVNMLLCFLVIFAVMILFGIETGKVFHIEALLYLPVVMLIQYVLALGGALLTSGLTVYFRDLEHILGIVTMAWMYLTPIVYPEEQVMNKMGEWAYLYNLNPMTPITIAYRKILYSGEVPDMSTLVNAAVLGVGFLVIGYVVFRKLQKGFAEEL